MDFTNYERTIEDVIATLKSAKKAKNKCTILVGAGCSVSAGIPTSKDIVEDIRKEYPNEWKRALPLDSDIKSYSSCMEQLAPEERRNLILKYIGKAGINWAHICLAKLVQEKYVDRVLTTNFDPLVLESCALLGFAPAVYDITSYPNKKDFKPSAIPDKAIFYLHGQYISFKLINTTEEGKRNIPNLTPFFRDSLEGRTWIVIGYSGENDPVFTMLSKVSCFHNKLYWICHSSEPSEEVKKKILKKGKYAFFIRNIDADAFFSKIVRDLKCVPEITTKPFSHLKDLLRKIKPYKQQQKEEDPTKYALEIIERAITEYEVDDIKSIKSTKDNLPELMFITKLLSEGKYDQIISLLTKDVLIESDEFKKHKADAFYYKGNSTLQSIKGKKRKDNINKLNEALDYYNKAIELNPNFAEAYLRKGHLIREKTIYTDRVDKETLLIEAKNMLDLAYMKNSNLLEALIDKGIVLYEEATSQNRERKGKTLLEAIKCFEKVLKTNRWNIDALNGQGISLILLATLKVKEEKTDLLIKAIAIMEKIIQIDSANINAQINKSFAMLLIAESSVDFVKKDKEFKEALEILKSALKNTNDVGLYVKIVNFINHNSNILNNIDVLNYYKDVIKVFDRTIISDPTSFAALHGRGLLLLTLAKKDDKDKLLNSAIETFHKLEEIQAGRGAYNIACAYSLLGNLNECINWLKISLKNNFLPSKLYILEDEDFKDIKENELFKEFINNIE